MTHLAPPRFRRDLPYLGMCGDARAPGSPFAVTATLRLADCPRCRRAEADRLRQLAAAGALPATTTPPKETAR